ncbi:MAG: methylated-DNA--[protein]-cysteine S-methyltransferase [Woeseiaceae bacterium]
MESQNTLYFNSVIGDISLEFSDVGLSSLEIVYETAILNSTVTKKLLPHGKLYTATSYYLSAYFSSEKMLKSLPLSLIGTQFQKKVWAELLNIPLGETRTYGEIAKQLNSSAQAVGNACRANPVQIVVPCHRVISAKGIGGYAGATDGKKLAIKKWLLEHEGVFFDD